MGVSSRGYETDFVSPYTNGAANADAALALVLQDWASADALRKPFHPEWAVLGHDPERITNKRLKKLLNDAFGLELADVFVTNLFPFIKPGGMSDSIPQRDLDLAFKEFCWPQSRSSSRRWSSVSALLSTTRSRGT